MMALPLQLGNAWDLIRQTFADWSEDDVPRHGAALAFYTALSIAPLLVLSLRITSVFFDTAVAQKHIQGQMQSMVGDEGSDAIAAMLTSANEPTTGTIATVFGVITLLFGASGVFLQLQDSLNKIWEVTPKQGRGIWGIIRDRFLSMAMVMGVAFLLLVSLVVSALLSFAGTYTPQWIANIQVVAQLGHLVISLIVFTGLFALIFKYVPDAKIAWRDVWVGAAMTAALFTAGKSAIGLYLGNSAIASSYGMAGSLIVVLVWVYYSAQIVFFGAEFTQVCANRFGTRIVPKENAETVTERSRQQT